MASRFAGRGKTPLVLPLKSNILYSHHLQYALISEFKSKQQFLHKLNCIYLSSYRIVDKQYFGKAVLIIETE